jgi:hypothetical protein
LKKVIVDLLERTGATFAQGFLAVIVVQQNVSEKTALYTGLTAGGFAVAKFLLAKANHFLQTPEK